jgi:hypothetical protein
VVLASYYLSTLSQCLQKLCENMCANEPYVCKELLFRLQTGRKDHAARLTYDKHSINFKFRELNYLLAAIIVIENQLARYSIAQNGIMTCVTTLLGPQVHIQFRPDAATYILLDVLFDELIVNMLHFFKS